MSPRKKNKVQSRRVVESRVQEARNTSSDQSVLQRLQTEMQSNRSYLSMVLGLLIVLVGGVLLYNYFKTDNATLGPSQQSDSQNQQEQAENKDADPNNLPGKYTVKEGDTLFTIAEQYYKDGYQYMALVKANNLTNENMLEVGQVLDIPKVEQAQQTPQAEDQGQGTGGAENVTIWGEKITGNTYTVKEGDWLSTIAGRAYGKAEDYTKIAQANNLSNPDLIEVGQVLKIPR